MASKRSSQIIDLLFSFEGRIGRGKYWLGVLLAVLLLVIAMVPLIVIVPWDQVMVAGAEGQPTLDYMHSAMLPFWIGYLFLMVIGYWMSIAISIKRFHDRGKSGWWYLILLIPYIGPIWGLIELGFLRGDPGANAYGPPAVSA